MAWIYLYSPEDLRSINFTANQIKLVGGATPDVIHVPDADSDGTLDGSDIMQAFNLTGTIVAQGVFTGNPGTAFYVTIKDQNGVEKTYVASSSAIQPNPSDQVVKYSNHVSGIGADPQDYAGVPCFTRGTLIETEKGLVAVEDLREGDMIATADDGFQPLRLKLSTKVGPQGLADNPKLRPIHISAGAMGEMLPKRDLLVSPQHRMLVNSAIVQRMFGEDEVLVAATRLTEMPGIYVDDSVTEVEYFHLLLDAHHVIYAEGAPTESFYTGPMALAALSPEALEEIRALFPEMPEPKAARAIPEGRMQRQLVERHQKNGKGLISA